jgi:hypothetical protein
MYGSNTSTDSSISFETTNVNGLTRKKSDLSCVGNYIDAFFKLKKMSYLVLFKDKIISFKLLLILSKG